MGVVHAYQEKHGVNVEKAFIKTRYVSYRCHVTTATLTVLELVLAESFLSVLFRPAPVSPRSARSG